jgi:hypothetical protein
LPLEKTGLRSSANLRQQQSTVQTGKALWFGLFYIQ